MRSKSGPMRHRPSIVLALALASTVAWGDEVRRFARFEHQGKPRYGLVEGENLRVIDGNILKKWKPTEQTVPLASVKLLAPVKPKKVFAVGLNYKSHLGDRPAPRVPEIFFKMPTCVIGPGESILLPKESTDVHFEGELVLVIGKKGRDIPTENAKEYVFGVTCGNDISERQWQKNDLQWWRAKGSDTFAPCGPYLVTGVDYDDLLLRLKVNGAVKQEQRTSDLLHPCADIVSWISRHVTLEPGDLIYTGTPGKTSALAPGDVVEVEIESVGTLSNPVERAP